MTGKTLRREIERLPIPILGVMADKCGSDRRDPKALLELQAIILEEVIAHEVDVPNALLAFIAVKDDVARRWKEWLNDDSLDTMEV